MFLCKREPIILCFFLQDKIKDVNHNLFTFLCICGTCKHPLIFHVPRNLVSLYEISDMIAEFFGNVMISSGCESPNLALLI